jgi:D-serine deaminase-like pyridoxal phosphate-dependent protein
MGAAVAVNLGAGAALAAPIARRRRADLGSGGSPMSLAAVAGLAKSIGHGEPVAIVDLAAVDHNCRSLSTWAAANKMTWRPAYKTLRSPQLLQYVLGKLDEPRVMIHHLRDLPQALPHVPRHTDFLMGYPPTVGELAEYLKTPPARGEKPFTLRINIDGLPLLRVLDDLSKHAASKLPVDVTLEIYNGFPRGGLEIGDDLNTALAIIGKAKGRLRLSALLCYDALASGGAAVAGLRKAAAQYAQDQMNQAYAAVKERASGFVDVKNLIRNGPASANYTNWAGSTAANELSPGSAVLFANYLDDYPDVAADLVKAFYLCAPVLRLPVNKLLLVGGTLPIPPGTEIVFVKAGGWPTGNNATLSKLAHPAGLSDVPAYGRGANSSGMIAAPEGELKLGDYVVETAQQVMEGQEYFGSLNAARSGKVLATWPVLSRWGGEREEVG